MRYLADENVPGPLVSMLREAGHDVAWILTDARGEDDRPILARGVVEHRIVLTLDLDFGELSFRDRLAGQEGVILFRLPTHSLQLFLQLAFAAVQSREDWIGHFTVIEPGRVRMTPLPD